MTPIDLAGKVALVTGGAQGIGLGIARRLVSAGATVIVGDIRSDLAADVAGAGAIFAALDVTDLAQVVDSVARIGADYKTIDILVNNAGIAHFASLAQTEPEDWRRIFAVDVDGVYLMSRACLRWLAAAGGGSIVQIASIHASLTVPGMSAYAAAKGAVVSLVRSMAQEFAPQGVRVNAISPGFVDTALYRGWRDAEPDPEAAEERVRRQIPTGHIASPDEVGDAIAFLASPLARSINGVNLAIDGGLATRLMH